jgi:hypothetical protein
MCALHTFSQEEGQPGPHTWTAKVLDLWMYCYFLIENLSLLAKELKTSIEMGTPYSYHVTVFKPRASCQRFPDQIDNFSSQPPPVPNLHSSKIICHIMTEALCSCQTISLIFTMLLHVFVIVLRKILKIHALAISAH